MIAKRMNNTKIIALLYPYPPPAAIIILLSSCHCYNMTREENDIVNSLNLDLVLEKMVLVEQEPL